MAEQEVGAGVKKPRRYGVATANDYFNKGKEFVESVKGGRYKIPRTWLMQQVREERGENDVVCRKGNWVKEGVLTIRDKTILTPTGLCYLHADEAQKEGDAYTLGRCTQNEIDKAVEEGLEVKAEHLRFKDDIPYFDIPCKDFGSNRYGLFFFGGEGTDEERSKRAKESGLWLINSSVNIRNIWVCFDSEDYSKRVKRESSKGGYAKQMWLESLGVNSALIGGCHTAGSLRFPGRVLGVFDSFKGEQGQRIG